MAGTPTDVPTRPIPPETIPPETIPVEAMPPLRRHRLIRLHTAVAAATAFFVLGVAVGVFLPWGRERVVQTPVVREAQVWRPPVSLTWRDDYGTRHLGDFTRPSWRLDYGTRHLAEFAPTPLSWRDDYATRHLSEYERASWRLDYGTRHLEG